MKRPLASQRKEYGRALVEIGEMRPDVVVLDADLSTSTRTADFAKKFPNRFFNCGIAEQNMMGTAAGLAASGKIVFASSFAVFATGRCWDQIRQSIAYTKFNVKIVATHAGITVGGDGASHQTAEDIALMRTLPNMTVVVPADAPETYKAIKAVVDWPGPCYVRLGRVDFPVVTTPETPFSIGKSTEMLPGDDVAVIATGQMVAVALDAAEELKKLGISASVINMSTIKPLDEETIIRCARKTGAIVTAEEHNILSGLGSAVAACLCENYPVPMKRVGIPDTFGESGESEELMVKYGLTSDEIVRAAVDVMRRKRK
ncbi:MAG: transketolase family protein [Methanomassiliicoccales archaeon]|jgi:transketolase|nr:transketolase family protein [Methanomassiliicoccales archaeon]